METRFAASRLGSTRRDTEITDATEQQQLPAAEAIQKFPSKRIAELVSIGWRLDAEIGALQERMGLIKARLVEEAKKGNRVGETVEFQGLEVGHKVSVTFPEDRLVSSLYFDESGEAIAYVNDEKTKLGKLKEFCGEHFRKLFMESFKPKSKLFRDLAVAFLGKEKGTRLIEKCTFPSAARVSFKNK